MIYAKERMSDAVRILGKDNYRRIYKETGRPGGWGHALYEDIRAAGPKNRKGMYVLKGNKKGGRNRNYISRQLSREYYDSFNK